MKTISTCKDNYDLQIDIRYKKMVKKKIKINTTATNKQYREYNQRVITFYLLLEDEYDSKKLRPPVWLIWVTFWMRCYYEI